NVKENPQAALVIDDGASTGEWSPRAVLLEGPAEATESPDGSAAIRISVDRVVSWGLRGLRLEGGGLGPIRRQVGPSRLGEPAGMATVDATGWQPPPTPTTLSRSVGGVHARESRGEEPSAILRGARPDGSNWRIDVHQHLRRQSGFRHDFL